MLPRLTKNQLILTLLLLIAIILGYAIARKLPLKSIESTFRDEPDAAPSNPASEQAGERERIGQVPDQNAPEEVKLAYYELVNRLGKSSLTLNISGCRADPLVLKIASGSSLTIQNDDPVARSVNLGSRNFPVPANGSLLITASFDTGPGVYGYGCDRGASTTGVLFITP